MTQQTTQPTQEAPVSDAPQAPAQSPAPTTNAPQAPAQAPVKGGRMVYGVDGAEPVSERELMLQEMAGNPMYQQSIDEAARRAIENQQPQGQEGQPAQPAPDAQVQEQYNEMAARLQHLQKYEGIIGALERDPRLVDLLQQGIAGQVADLEMTSRQDDFESVLGEPTGEEPAGSTRPTQGMTEEQRIAAAVERRFQQEKARNELQEVLNEMLQSGSTAEEAEAYVKFVADPTGVTARDLLVAFRERNKKAQGPQQPTPQPAQPRLQQPRTMPPPPLAAASGSTDRPPSERLYVPDQSGHQFYAGDPNDL